MQAHLKLLLLGACYFSAASASLTELNSRGESWSSWGPPPTAPSVTLDSGIVNGKIVEAPGSTTKVRQFLGIPFAQPPVGDLRFAPPQVPKSWSNPLNATTYSSTCIQNFGSTPELRATYELLFDTPPPMPDTESEDCLYLNVYVPDCGKVKDKPVLFWIYGGAFVFGSGSLPLYDGTNLAANQDVIVVTFNYRVDLFGYPMSPQLPLNQRNLGHLDQRLALDWVQRNIHAFGGDPKKVTIAGESAGAVSVDDLILTMPHNPPFRAGILESGQDTVRFALQLTGGNSTSWDELAQAVKCTSGTDTEILACVRAVSADTLKNISQSEALKFGPIFDNTTRLQYPIGERQAGNVAKVPTLTGSNYDDGSAFTLGSGSNVSEFLSSHGIPSNVTETIVKLYAPGSAAAHGLTNGSDIITRIFTDGVFFCPSIYYSNITATVDSSPAWLYLFNATFPNTQHPQFPKLGAYHSSEISLVFGTYPRTNQTDKQVALSRYMQKTWADFVKDPQKGPGWMKYPAVEVFSSGLAEPVVNETTIAGVQGQICELWDQVYAKSAS